MHPTSPEAVISKARLETLFDGIFAIAMTILVLEVRVPVLADPGSSAELRAQLARTSPTLFSYGLSFVILGSLWYRHNQLNHHVARVTALMLGVQLFQMAVAAFFPFCAALLGRFPLNLTARLAYAGSVLAYTLAQTLHFQLARRAEALKPELDLAAYRGLQRRNLRSCLVLAATLVIFLVVG